MFDFLKNKRGYTLVEVIVAVTLITTLVASYVNLFNGMLTSTTYFRDNMTAQMLAANKWKELDLVAYPSLTAEAKATVGTTGLQREVILGADVDLGGGNHKRDVTINVYKTGSSTVLYTAPKTVTSAGSGAGVSHGQQIFTASGNFTVPPDVTKVYISGTGGGGGGGKGYYYYSDVTYDTYIAGGGGGGGAAQIKTLVTVIPNETIAITIGAGGKKGDATAPGSGGVTRFGSYLTINGGQGGSQGTTPYSPIGGSSGGNGGMKGQGNNGGGSLYGIGGPGGFGNSPVGIDGQGYGAGGGGGYGNSNGGAGTSGFLVIEW